MNVTYHQVKKEQLHLVWNVCKEQIKKAMEHSLWEMSLEDIRRSIASDKMVLVVGMEGEKVVLTAVFEFIYYPQFTSFKTITLTGDTAGIMDNFFKEYVPTIVAWAKSLGAEKLEANCHPSMTRLLQRYGFVPTYTVLFKDVE